MAIADNARQEHLKEIQSMKAFDDLFKGLESKVEWEMARISNLVWPKLVYVPMFQFIQKLAN